VSRQAAQLVRGRRMYTQWDMITNQLYRYSSWDHLERDLYHLFELDHIELKSIPHELTAGSVLVHIEATPRHADSQLRKSAAAERGTEEIRLESAS